MLSHNVCFWRRRGAQGVTISVCLSVCVKVLIRSLNLYQSLSPRTLSGLSQVCLKFCIRSLSALLANFVGQTEPKILCLVYLWL